jgi:aldose 1-epimerase
MPPREIRNGDLSVGLVPEIGGSVSYFREGATDLMRPLSDADRDRGDVLGVSMFPMIPYANRIADNAFIFEGRTYRFAPNNPPERFNVHGTAWHLPWSEERIVENEAVLTLVQDAPDEPYSYAARQRFKLLSDRLVVTTEVENRGERRMPFGFGQHPWFIRDPDVSVEFRAGAFWIEGWDNTASERIATPPELAFFPRRPLPRARRNNCYALWDGSVEIAWPSRRLRLRIEADPIFKHLMLYADPARPVFCLEPQTNSVCAFNMPADAGDDFGTIVLEPGQKASGAITFAPSSA